jgi:prophage regulatory protein
MEFFLQHDQSFWRLIVHSEKRVLRRRAVLDKLGISNTHLFNLERAGDFPRHFMLSPRCAAWFESEVDEWLTSRSTRTGGHADKASRAGGGQ